MSIKKDIRFRVYVAFTGILLFAVAIIVKVAYIQIAEGDALKENAEKSLIKKQNLPADRGNIYSENGQLLSSTIPQFDIRLDFKAIQPDTFKAYLDTLSIGIANVFQDASAQQYKQRLQSAFNKGERYFLFKRNIPYYQYHELRALPIFKKGKNKGGFIAESKSKRVNPYGMLGYRTIGLWRENVENIGLEQSYDSVLAGVDGSRIVRKSTLGVYIPLAGSEIEPKHGKDIVTTIDIDIQDIAEHALLRSLEANKCQFGTAIVMETKTGKIRAMANLGRQTDGSYWEDFNYALIPSEPGSTFKLLSLFSLIEDGFVTIDDKVDVQGGLAVFGRQRVVDDHRGMGVITIENAFAQSSNVAFAKLINQYYSKKPMKYIEHLQSFGLNKRTGVDLQGERSPMIKTTKSQSWNKVTSLPWIAYGYESLITPLHTCMAYNAIANNGRLMKPYLVSAVKEYGQEISSFQPIVLKEKIGKESTIKQLQQSMKAVVETGTGKRIKSPYYTAAGKTGTAQVADKGIKYADGVRQGSFVGYFPFENPQYTIAVVIRSTPHGPYYGGVVAAPVFKEIADKLYATKIGGWELMDSSVTKKELVAKAGLGNSFNVVFEGLNVRHSKSNSWDIINVVPQQDVINLNAIAHNGKVIPDVKGMGLKDALYVLESLGLNVQVKGVGKVTEQSLTVGSKVISGQKILIQLG